MSNNKEEGKGLVSTDSQESAPRARNRTVMLTPDITTQVRARLSRKVGNDESSPAQKSIFDPDLGAATKSSDSINLPYQEFVAESSAAQNTFDSSNSELNQSDQYPSDTLTEEHSYLDQPLNDSSVEDQGFNPIARQVHTLETDLPADSKNLVSHEQNEVSEARQTEEEVAAKEILMQPAVSLSAEAITAGNVRNSVSNKKLVNPNDNQESKMTSKSFEVSWAKVTPIVGFFVSFDNDPNGEFLILRSGRLLISSEIPSSGSYLYIDNQTISPMHAILRITEDSQVQLLDNLSEYGTVVRRAETGEELTLSGEKSLLYHGDFVKFGEKSFYLCLLKKV